MSDLSGSSLHTPEPELIDALLRLAWFDEVGRGRGVAARAQAAAWLDGAIDAGLPARVAEGVRWFDAPLTFNFIRERGLTGDDPLWRERIVADKRRDTEAYCFASPPVGDEHAPTRITLLFERVVVRRDLPPGKATILVLPLPQEEPTQRDVVVEPIAQAGVTLTIDGDTLVRRGPVPPDGMVRVGARISFTATWRTHRLDGDDVGPSPADAADPELQPYLAAEEGLLRITPPIRALAESLRKPGAIASVRAFWEHIFDHMVYGVVHYDELGTDDPLSVAIRGRWFDCYVGSCLLGALCRAVGLPARLVHGTLLWARDLGPHYWLEVRLPRRGWVPFDLHAWMLASGDKRAQPWAGSSFGRLPHQLVLFRLPVGRPQLSLRLPEKWYSLQRLEGDQATSTEIHDRVSGALSCLDRLERTAPSSLA